MLYKDLPEELRTELEEKKVAVGRWPAGLNAPRQYDDIILIEKDDEEFEKMLIDKGYIVTTVANWYGKTAQSFIGDDEQCIKLVKNALMSDEETTVEEVAEEVAEEVEEETEEVAEEAAE